MQINLIRLFVVTLALLAFSTSYSAAHINAEGIIKERMDTMSSMGSALGIIVNMIKGKSPFDPQEATQAAGVLHDHAVTAADQFPDTDKSRNGKHSQALASIWKDRAEFDGLMDKLELEAEKLAQVTAMNKPDLVRPQFAEVVEICSACHEKFRKAKQN